MSKDSGSKAKKDIHFRMMFIFHVQITFYINLKIYLGFQSVHYNLFQPNVVLQKVHSSNAYAWFIVLSEFVLLLVLFIVLNKINFKIRSLIKIFYCNIFTQQPMTSIEKLRDMQSRRRSRSRTIEHSYLLSAFGIPGIDYIDVCFLCFVIYLLIYCSAFVRHVFLAKFNNNVNCKLQYLVLMLITKQ
ncbi:hypothetical protein KUF71_021770 [Frankliniella fusca]|uniref:Uncharacterized protein n=1 Tax=Frankliniella fusca TaxID=407009 RepID=A0AAE1LAD8_9NEOP|nr:hypothetical protein KUF71_021770 [Frankliniella fusca]